MGILDDILKKKDKFSEEYEDYVKRKQRERSTPQHLVVKKLPEVEEIKNRPEIQADETEKEISAKKWIKTGIGGFDDLMEKGIPQGVSILVAGGPGSGKTIFCLQTLYNAAAKGTKCLYVSFEESEDRLRSHMNDFGWDVGPLEKKGVLKMIRIDPFKISRMVEALLAKAKGELLIGLDDLYETLPHDFKAKMIVFDSLSALGAAFSGGDQNYRIYIEQLFRLFEKMGVTSFLISETDQVPSSYSKTGIEEFLADGVFVFYNVKRENDRVRAIEILKLRGAKHRSKIVPFEIKKDGITVYPTEPVFM